MLLVQLILVSLRKMPKPSRKVTNLRAQSLTVPRAQLNYGSFSHLKLRSVAEAQSANPSI